MGCRPSALSEDFTMSTNTPHSTSVSIGDQTLEVEYFVSGRHHCATLTDPEEWPEIEFYRLRTPGGEDISGLMEFQPVYDKIMEQLEESVREDDYAGPDPDEAYDRWKDAQLEKHV